jgi:hypothetical protein
LTSCRVFRILLLILLTALTAGAADYPVHPVTDGLFDALTSPVVQLPALQARLTAAIPASEGCFVTGPLDPLFAYDVATHSIYHSVRIMCPSLAALDNALAALVADSGIEVIVRTEQTREPKREHPPGYRGVLAEVGAGHIVQFLTVQQLRWLIWARYALFVAPDSVNQEALDRYAIAVSDYLYDIEMGVENGLSPVAVDYGLPEELDLYAPAPDYVIQGYANYKAFLNQYRAIHTDYARGIVSFIPGDSLLTAFTLSAPPEAYPNKEAPKLQEEYREFFERRGNPRIMETLTGKGFDTLRDGEYFFAVNVNGQVRFGRELLREEVNRIESETGRKVPRANHAFLFPGEPVLTAGAFHVEHSEDGPRLVEVNGQSGHFFYSNIQPTIREDIAERSDHYLSTLGHFFQSLDSLGIRYESVLITKM